MPSFLEQDYNARVPNPQAPITLASAQAPVATAASFATAPAVTVPQQKASSFQGATAPKAYLNPRDPKSPGYIPPNYQLPPVKLPTNHYVPPAPATNVDPNISVGTYGSGVSATSPGVVAGALAAGIDPATLGNYGPDFLSTLDDMSRPETAFSKFLDATLGQLLPITPSGKLGGVFSLVPAVGTGIATFKTVTSIFGKDEEGSTLLDSVKDTIFGSSKGKGKGILNNPEVWAEQAAQRGRSAPPVGAPAPVSYTNFTEMDGKGIETDSLADELSSTYGQSSFVSAGPSAGVAPAGTLAYNPSRAAGSAMLGSGKETISTLPTPTRVGYRRQSGYDFETPTASELGVAMFGVAYGMGGEISQNFAIGGRGAFTSFGHYAAGISQADEMGIVSKGLLGGKNRAFMTPEEGKDVVDAMVRGGHSEDVITAVATGQTNTAEITALAEATGAGDAGVGGKSIVCTQMYKTTGHSDWEKAMKLWYIYQSKYLTPLHQEGYHYLFGPFVKGMKKSNTLTAIGAYLAKHRTNQIKHELFKTPPFDIVGKLTNLFLHPTVYAVGKFKNLMENKTNA